MAPGGAQCEVLSHVVALLQKQLYVCSECVLQGMSFLYCNLLEHLFLISDSSSKLLRIRYPIRSFRVMQ